MASTSQDFPEEVLNGRTNNGTIQPHVDIHSVNWHSRIRFKLNKIFKKFKREKENNLCFSSFQNVTTGQIHISCVVDRQSAGLEWQYPIMSKSLSIQPSCYIRFMNSGNCQHVYIIDHMSCPWVLSECQLSLFS